MFKKKIPKHSWIQALEKKTTEREVLSCVRTCMCAYVREREREDLRIPQENQTHRAQNQQEQPKEQLKVDSETCIINKVIDK